MASGSPGLRQPSRFGGGRGAGVKDAAVAAVSGREWNNRGCLCREEFAAEEPG